MLIRVTALVRAFGGVRTTSPLSIVPYGYPYIGAECERKLFRAPERIQAVDGEKTVSNSVTGVYKPPRRSI